MNVKQCLFCLFVFLPLSVAADSIRWRNCRQGTPTNHTLVHASAHRAAGENPYLGDRRQLVVLVSFSDQQFMNNQTMTQWNKIFNQKNLTESPFYGSVHDYFYAQSYGQFRLTFDLYEIALNESRVKYRSTAANDENSQYLVTDIVDVLRTKDVDWGAYDWDGDGYVNQLLIVYAGKGMNSDGDSNTIWPHQWWMSEHKNSQGEKLEPLTVSSGGKDYKVDCYCCVQEQTRNTYGTFGTICHEYSHCFGLPDFYYGSYSFVSYWDLMDRGNYSAEGFCPTGYSSWERMFLGWLTPTELSEPATITQMTATSTTPEAYLIRNDNHPDEYYLVENRQQQGWDTFLPGSGLVVFHIDYDYETWTYYMPNTMNIQRYSIFPANNMTYTAYATLWAYPYLTKDSLTNLSAPASTLHYAQADGTMLMSKPLTNMKVTDGLASFHFMGGAISGIGNTISSSQTHTVQSIYDLRGQKMGSTDLNSLPRGLYIVRYADGSTLKVRQ